MCIFSIICFRPNAKPVRGLFASSLKFERSIVCTHTQLCSYNTNCPLVCQNVQNIKITLGL